MFALLLDSKLLSMLLASVGNDGQGAFSVRASWFPFLQGGATKARQVGVSQQHALFPNSCCRLPPLKLLCELPKLVALKELAAPKLAAPKLAAPKLSAVRAEFM